MARVLVGSVALLTLTMLAGCTRSPDAVRTVEAPSSATRVTPTSNPPATAAPNAPQGDARAMPTDANAAKGTTEEAMFGAGCFWGVESYFQQLPGVVQTAVGYSGGKVENPTYRQVCDDTTGHAEVIHIVFDPSKVTYEKLVRHFFHMHDPTQLNRQGPDYGRQYRSAIFTYSDAQRDTAAAVRDRLTAAGKYKRPIVTEIAPAKPFWKAEEYHQKYFDKNGGESCHIAPDGELD